MSMIDHSKLSRALSRARREIAKDKKRSKDRMNEKETLHHLIEPVLGAIGWAMDDSDQVRREYPTTLGHVDLALLIDDKPVLFVEAKALKHSVDDEKWIKQTVDYANGEGVDWCILTNGAEYRIYQTRAPGAFKAKHFTDVNIDIMFGDATNQSVEAMLSLLSPQSMRLDALKRLWDMRDVDKQVQYAIDDIITNLEFREFISQKIQTNFTAATVNDSLQRATFGVDYPNIVECTKMVTVNQYNIDKSDKLPKAKKLDKNKPHPTRGRAKTKKMETTEMVERGLLKEGTKLTIKNRPGSEATVIDGKNVKFQGNIMSFHQWGKRVLQQKVSIYLYATLPNNETLDQIRTMADKSKSLPIEKVKDTMHQKSRRSPKPKVTGEMRTPEMFEKGLLTAGTVLTIKNRPRSQATVVDGHYVNYKGSTIKYNEWAQKILGYPVSIYAYVLLPNGQKLREVR